MSATGPEPAPLARAAAARGAASPADVFDAFVSSRLWSPRPPQPGVVALDVLGELVVPVFSSEVELAAFAGEVDWFSTTGEDLLGLLPAGVTLGLDLASDHRLQLDPAAVRLERSLFIVPGGPGPGRTRPPGAGTRGSSTSGTDQP